MKGITLVENRSELGAGTRGASLGINALKVAAWNFNSSYFKKYKSLQVKDQNHIITSPVDTPSAKRIGGLFKVYENQMKVINKVLIEKKNFPIALSADHACAGGTIAGIKKAYPEKRLGVIWIDAHGDLHSPYTSPSGNMHGMPLAAALALDNLESKRNKLKAKTVIWWNKIKTVGGIAPKVRPDDVVFIGLRDLEQEEISLLNRYNMLNISVEQVRKDGVDFVLKNAFDKLKDCDIIYVSLDVDSMDPKLSSYGTGTPVPGGFSPEEIRSLLNPICDNSKVMCLEIVEVNPALDDKNKMAEIAFQILDSATSVIANRINPKPKAGVRRV